MDPQLQPSHELGAEFTLEASLAMLARITGIELVDPDTPVQDLHMDSMDVLEWVFTLEDELGVQFDEKSLKLSEMPVVTLRALHERIVFMARAQAHDLPA